MKQFIFCTHELKLKTVVLTNATVRNFDCVSPQKTYIEIPLNYDIENNDIVVIRDQNTMETEYIGIIDTVVNDKTTTILLYPFEEIFDNDCMLSDLDGDVYTWIVNCINDNYVGTGDALNDYAIEFDPMITHMANAVSYKMIVESENLLDNLGEIFLNTGIYLRFRIRYDANGYPEKIMCEVHNANEEEVLAIRFDNPIIVDNKVSIERSHTGNFNKAIIRIINEDDEVSDVIKIYLKENNTLTTNPEDQERIKQVKPKLINYKPSDDEITAEEQGEAIILLAQKALCGNAFDHSIEFTVVLNDGYKWKINKRCDFLSEDRIFNTYITSVEYLSDRHAKITLGAYRYTLTDRFKAFRKKEAAADSIKGVAVTDLLGNTLFWFEQDEDGDLYLCYNEDTFDPYEDDSGTPVAKFSIDGSGDMWFTYQGEQGDGKYSTKYELLDSTGELVYNL